MTLKKIPERSPEEMQDLRNQAAAVLESLGEEESELAPFSSGGPNPYVSMAAASSGPYKAQDRELTKDQRATEEPSSPEDEEVLPTEESEQIPEEEPQVDAEAAAAAHGFVVNPGPVQEIGEFSYDTSGGDRAPWSVLTLSEQIHWKKARALAT